MCIQKVIGKCLLKLLRSSSSYVVRWRFNRQEMCNKRARTPLYQLIDIKHS